jgi:phosphoserine phosphatase
MSFSIGIMPVVSSSTLSSESAQPDNNNTNSSTLTTSSIVDGKTSNKANSTRQDQLLPSWNEGITKKRIIAFVENATDSRSPNYIPPEERIAVFDNDGTLWSEKPIYFEGFFILERLEELYKTNPQIRQQIQEKPEFEQLLKKNFTNLHLSMEDVLYLGSVTHANITTPEFNSLVERWAETAQHPQTHKRFVEMVYQPMIELIKYLNENRFKTFIVTAGGLDFVREALSEVYGIPNEQIIGSSIKYQYINKSAGNSTIFREPKLNSFDDSDAKPENIQLHIGKVPVLAAGNTNGDAEMLKYTDDNNKPGSSLEIVILHDDCVREYCYVKKPDSEQVLEEARNSNWVVVSMKADFREIYPEKQAETLTG